MQSASATAITFNVNEGDLRKIAERTGGRAYFPRHERDLSDAFAQIQRDLREQYLVAYSPTNKVSRWFLPEDRDSSGQPGTEAAGTSS